MHMLVRRSFRPPQLDVYKRQPSYWIDYGPILEKEIALLEQALAGVPDLCRRRSARWLAIKLLEKDADILQEIRNSANEQANTAYGKLIAELEVAAEEACARVKKAACREAVDLIAEKRYELAASISASVIVSRPDDAEITPTQRIDKFVLHPWLAYPIFFVVVWLM